VKSFGFRVELRRGGFLEAPISILRQFHPEKKSAKFLKTCPPSTYLPANQILPTEKKL
jgi:hypothetical protein